MLEDRYKRRVDYNSALAIGRAAAANVLRLAGLAKCARKEDNMIQKRGV